MAAAAPRLGNPLGLKNTIAVLNDGQGEVVRQHPQVTPVEIQSVMYMATLNFSSDRAASPYPGFIQHSSPALVCSRRIGPGEMGVSG